MASHTLSFGIVTAALLLSTGVSAQAPQEPPTTQPAPAPPERVVDEVFVAQTTRNARAEIEVGKLALRRSERPDVKMMAQRIVDDLTRMNADLTVMASAKQIILPDEPPEKTRVALAELEHLTGKDFDRTYVTQVIASHGRSIDAFKTYNAKGADAALKVWAMKTVPSLQLHLDRAREVERKLG